MILFTATTGVPAILDDTGDLITSILTYLTQFTGWILGNDLAKFFFAIMVMMLGVHVLHSLVHKFS